MRRPLLPFIAGYLLLISGCLHAADSQVLEKTGAEGDPWWHQIFSISFDGHGNFVVPNLDTLHTTAASVGAVGYHGPWQADLARDSTWMGGYERSLALYPATKRIVYIEGNSAKKVLARISTEGRVLFTAPLLAAINDPQRRSYIESLIKQGGRTIWFSDWEFMQSPALKTPLDKTLPTAFDLGVPAFTHPLDGSPIHKEADFWRTRSGSALIGTGRASDEGANQYAEIPEEIAGALGLREITTQRSDGQWLISSSRSMLYDAQFASYQAAKGRRVMETLAPDMIHYDDWDLRSPTDGRKGRHSHRRVPRFCETPA